LITHWTYTMPDTWIFLENYIDKDILKNISVVITWAMFPWNVFWSDAPMNVWASISSLLNSEKPLGVKICMHWKNWDVNHIKKDAENLIFEEK
jgi:L-asparaginase/Glu-tRNA(Gln) amidotransferase subunit D